MNTGGSDETGVDPAGTAPSSPSASNHRGLISTFVRHGTAPNLLMMTLVLIGVFAIAKLNRQFFPTIEIPVITVTVPWPGASAEDVESNILDVLEPELRFLDDVNEVTSIASEGSAVISIELMSGADAQKAQSDVEQAVARVTTLPETAERPIISRAAFFDQVAKIAVSGPFTEKVLKTYAKQIRDGLLFAGIDRVTFNGARDEEIWISLKEADLRRLGLTLDGTAQIVRENTQDTPAGKLEGNFDVLLRSKAQRRTPELISEIEIRSTTTGEKIKLKDIAEIGTRYDREGHIGFFEGNRGIELVVQRSVSADTLETMRIMNAYLEELRPTLPPTLHVTTYDVSGKLVVGRLTILIENGLQGLVLVLAMLFIFLNARIAFWVAAGIPISLLAALGVMWATGQSINMVSMFAMIMMLGIIVDDAIVVGEQAATNEENGMPRLEAAEQGAIKMFAPVVAATLTTACAFMPIMFISDRMGDIMGAIPLVVLSVLAASTIECFLILPGHLRHGHAGKIRPPSRARAAFDRRFGHFRDHWFTRWVTFCYRWRYTTVAAMIAILILSVGMLAGGRVGFEFFPSPEPENITADVTFAPGTPRSAQSAATAKIEAALYRAEEQLLADFAAKPKASDDQQSNAANPEKVIVSPRDAQSSGVSITARSRPLPATEPRLVETVFTTIGKSGRSQGDNLAEINVQLTPSEERLITTKRIIAAWQKARREIPGVERVAISGRRGGPPGRDVDVRLQNGDIETLKQAAEEVKLALTSFPGVSGINDDLTYGKQEYVFELTPRGLALGFTGQNIGRQVRNAFEGNIATRFARDDEEIIVRVKRQQDLAGRADLERLYLTTPAGERVPLTEVVNISERRSFSIIQRKDGVATVAVTADIDSEVTKSQDVLDRLATEALPPIMEKYGLSYIFKGRADERQRSFKDLKAGALLALSLIYIVLGWVFASYWKPIAVMAIIPFGFVGAVYGHYIMGYNLTIISLIGLLGLSGILVNDSIVLVTRIRERILEGEDLEQACTGGARDRFRAVLLTSLTTIGGLLPLIFETSRQAQFLIPMALTLVFGLATATVLVLILVPCLIGVGGDVARLAGRRGRDAFAEAGSRGPNINDTPAPAE
ncbi:MAG: efflux RND transporter permease subunit [Hyphomicrobiaceae bacterium]|nr:efflux RND transporter permease subunit [Hyphomicrobiaceae bacterium]MCC0010834.1 efflux RND transporter permease subunit [Hyphomicrobiaceae bacterium]